MGGWSSDRHDQPAAKPPYYEADNVGRLYRVTDGAGVHPTGVTIPEWASRNDITPSEFDARVKSAAPIDDEGITTIETAPLLGREPKYVYAASREEAQLLLDNSYLKKYRAVPVRWWRRWLRV